MTPPREDLGLRESLSAEELHDAWPLLDREDRLIGFGMLERVEAEEFFFSLSARDQAELVLAMQPYQRRSWIRLLPPDDVADLVQEAPDEERETLLSLLDEPTRKEVIALLAYAEDEAGGLMNPRYARLRPDMTVDEAISYVRRQARDYLETIYYLYVLDEQQHLLGVVSFRDLFASPPATRVRDVMQTNVIRATEEQDQESVSRLFAEHDLVAIPVVNNEGQMKGIVTVDDIVDVVEEEATEDIQKLGGVEALGEPYLQASLRQLVRKRGGWLAVLFVGEMLTASVMGRFQTDIARAVVLALFVPLIISSGGNSGSQASTLVIRAMALGEVRLRDWWRVVRREVMVGLGLGAILGTIGLVRILLWQALFHPYGEHYLLIAATVAFSLVGVVLWGTLAGSTLPFILRVLRFDPASASAPFVATMVDVSGLLIYFTMASFFLRGTLL
jgi:magnesium transporter